jgi:hypothetical protein
MPGGGAVHVKELSLLAFAPVSADNQRHPWCNPAYICKIQFADLQLTT